MQNVQSSVINDGNSNGKGGKPECTMPLCKERHHWTSKDGKKNLKKFQLFLSSVSEYPHLGSFTVLQTEGRKDLGEGLGKNDEVLLQEKRQSITFVIEGCRRDLSGASGQTAL